MRWDRGRRFRRCLHPIETLEPRTLLSTTWVVTSTADDGTSGTLRYAINNSAGGDTIVFSASTFAAGSPHTIALTQGPLEIAHQLTIQGPDPATLTISGNNATRTFQIDASLVATISGMTLTGGNAGSNAGGAINNNGGSLYLTNVVVSHNTARLGGGVYTLNGSTVATNCTFANNTATNYGGAFDCDTGTVAEVTSSTFYNNTAPNGGAVLDYGNNVSLYNCTITANSATSGPGGGISNIQGYLYALDSTIVANTSTQSGAGAYIGSPSVTFKNSIVAQNTLQSGTTPSDISGTAYGLSNLIGDGSGGLLASDGNRLGSPSNLLSPSLYPLANYGGPTLTMLPKPGSPVIDAGNNSLVTSNITTDQRGFTRIVDNTVDIGADEYGGRWSSRKRMHRAT